MQTIAIQSLYNLLVMHQYHACIGMALESPHNLKHCWLLKCIFGRTCNTKFNFSPVSHTRSSYFSSNKCFFPCY